MWRGAGGEVFLALKSTFKPHPKSFSCGGRIYVAIRGLQIHYSLVED